MVPIANGISNLFYIINIQVQDDDAAENSRLLETAAYQNQVGSSLSRWG